MIIYENSEGTVDKRSPDVCKTKKGPPMDGTECGPGRWCVNGYCEPMSRKRSKGLSINFI